MLGVNAYLISLLMSWFYFLCYSFGLSLGERVGEEHVGEERSDGWSEATAKAIYGWSAATTTYRLSLQEKNLSSSLCSSPSAQPSAQPKPSPLIEFLHGLPKRSSLTPTLN